MSNKMEGKKERQEENLRSREPNRRCVAQFNRQSPLIVCVLMIQWTLMEIYTENRMEKDKVNNLPLNTAC